MIDTQNIQRLLPQHYAIIDMAVAGHTPKVIAETLNRSTESIRLLLNAPNVQHEISIRRKDGREATTLGLDRDAVLGKARSVLEQATEKAALRVVGLIDNFDPAIALRASDKILDRVFGPTGGGGNKAPIINVSAEQIALVNLTLKELNSHVIHRNPTNEAVAVNPRNGLSDVRQDSGSGQDPADSQTTHSALVGHVDVHEEGGGGAS